MVKIITASIGLLLLTFNLGAQVYYENEIFGIYFPTEPVLTKEKAQYGEKKIKLYGLSSTNDEGRIYTVNYYEYPENTTTLKSTSVSKSIIESFIEVKRIKEIDEPEVFNYKGYSGMEFSGFSEIEKKYYNLRVFLYDGNIIQIGIVSENNLPHKRLVKNYFKGLEFKSKED